MKKTDKYLFFWKEWLSQWKESFFEDIDGVTYCCAEQYMMAHKALLFGDTESYKKIMATNNPYIHQQIGREVMGYEQRIWDEFKEDIVYKGNYYKFTQNKDLYNKLIATAPLILVEASPFDTIWGIGMDENHREINDENKWKGKNLLGKTLTKLRKNLMAVS